MTYAESGLFWSQCFLPSLVIRKAQAGAGKSSLGVPGPPVVVGGGGGGGVKIFFRESKIFSGQIKKGRKIFFQKHD